MSGSKLNTLKVLKDISELKDLKVRFLEVSGGYVKHPDLEWVEREYRKWGQSWKDFNENIHHLNIIYTGYIYVKGCSKESLVFIHMALENAFQIDTYWPAIKAQDDKAKALAMAEEMCGKAIETIITGKCDEDFVLGKRLLLSLEPFRREATEEQWTYFKNGVKEFFEYQIKIFRDYWITGECIPLEDYVDFRLRESSWPMIAFMAEYSVGYPFPQKVRDNPLVKRFHLKGSELALAVDDYLMAKHKIMTNDITSRIISYLNEKRCTLQEAFDNQYQYVMNLNNECNQLRDRINSDPELSSEKLNDWMHTILSLAFALFPCIQIPWELEVSEDKTIRSSKWEKTLEQLVKGKNKNDPWALTDI